MILTILCPTSSGLARNDVTSGLCCVIYIEVVGKEDFVMTTKTVDLEEAQFDLNALLALLTADTEVILTRGETPVARVTPLAPPPPIKERIPGLDAGTTWMSDDFDDPLPDEFWFGEE